MIGGADHLRAALADRYTIERELGRGGNAVVYLAHDRKHDRKVAVKVLPPELALAVRSERFLREIQIAAKLTHPHILPLYDSGQAGDLLYYVMPYVAGESLRDRLRREKQLPVEEALRLTHEIAEVLDYAHRQGVVHRDIKPENVLLQEGHAVVADFGIARALVVAGGESVTQSGVAVGTPAYMSPEQAAGSGEVDGRSDVYSLGCVCYEMLAGRPPFTGATAQETLARHALDPVPSVRAACPEAPEGVEAALRRALAKTPVNRFATAADFAAALAGPTGRPRALSPRRRLLYASLTLVLLVGAALAARALVVGARPTERSVAVLPFVNLSGDPDNEYLSDGMTEELINALVQIEGLQVPARTSSFYFKGKTLTASQIGDSLRVSTVLEGSLRKTGSKLRITAQLINTANGYHMWSQTFDRELTGAQEAIPVQEEIARAIVGALELKLTGDTAAALVRRYTSDPAAYELYLRGRFFWNKRTAEGTIKAIEHFERAIAKDSTYALAYSGLADTYVLAGNQGFLPRQRAYLAAKAAANRALAVDETLAEAHTSLGRVQASLEWDLAGAERAFQRAIALNPRYSWAHSWYGLWVLGVTGRFEAAIREVSLAVELEPLAPATQFNLCQALYHARRYDEAIAQCRKANELAPDDYVRPHDIVGHAYRAKGMLAAALQEYQTALSVNPTNATRLGALGRAYAESGRPGEARRILAQLRERSRSENVWGAVAAVHVGLSEGDNAIQALERAFAEGPVGNPDLAVVEYWDPLRSDPRFVRLLRRMNLVDVAAAP